MWYTTATYRTRSLNGLRRLATDTQANPIHPCRILSSDVGVDSLLSTLRCYPHPDAADSRFADGVYRRKKKAIQRSLGKRAMIARLQGGPGAPYLPVGFLLRFCKSRTTGCRRQASGRSTLGDTWCWLASHIQQVAPASVVPPNMDGWMFWASLKRRRIRSSPRRSPQKEHPGGSNFRHKSRLRSPTGKPPFRRFGKPFRPALPGAAGGSSRYFLRRRFRWTPWQYGWHTPHSPCLQ